MLEPLFGSAAPMWTTPPSGFGPQPPFGLGNLPIGPPVFGPQNLAGFAGAIPAATQPGPVSGPIPTNAYGYAPGLIAISPHSFGASSLARSPIAVGTEPLVGLTAPSLLAAVAMRRGQPQGPTTDQEIEDIIYDVFELLPGASEVEVRCEGGRATLTGNVPHKRAKHDVGEIAWAIPILHDVQNNVAIASRRRSRGGAREGEGGVNVPNRKQS
jgi:hypothetical protein